MMDLIMLFHALGGEAVDKDVPVAELISMDVRERIARAKFLSEEKMEEFDKVKSEIEKSFKELMKKAVTEA